MRVRPSRPSRRPHRPRRQAHSLALATALALAAACDGGGGGSGGFPSSPRSPTSPTSPLDPTSPTSPTSPTTPTTPGTGTPASSCANPAGDWTVTCGSDGCGGTGGSATMRIAAPTAQGGRWTVSFPGMPLEAAPYVHVYFDPPSCRIHVVTTLAYTDPPLTTEDGYLITSTGLRGYSDGALTTRSLWNSASSSFDAFECRTSATCTGQKVGASTVVMPTGSYLDTNGVPATPPTCVRVRQSCAAKTCPDPTYGYPVPANWACYAPNDNSSAHYSPCYSEAAAADTIQRSFPHYVCVKCDPDCTWLACCDGYGSTAGVLDYPSCVPPVVTGAAASPGACYASPDNIRTAVNYSIP